MRDQKGKIFVAEGRGGEGESACLLRIDVNGVMDDSVSCNFSRRKKKKVNEVRKKEVIEQGRYFRCYWEVEVRE